MDWDAGKPVLESVTLHCVSTGQSALKWCNLMRQTSQDHVWHDEDRDRLAATLFSCLQQNAAIAAIVLQYCALGIGQAGGLCTIKSLKKALLDCDVSLILAETLDSICTLLSGAESVVYTPRRCRSAVELMQRGAEIQSENVQLLAEQFLQQFCSTADNDFEGPEQQKIVATIESIAIPLAEPQRRLLERLRTRLIESSRSSLKVGLASSCRVEDLFDNAVALRDKLAPKWLEATTSSSATVQPEVANLLHFLVDDFSPWHTKLEAVKLYVQIQQASFGDRRIEVYTQILHAAATACAAVAGSPAPLGGDAEYASLWRSALCGLLPSLIEGSESADGDVALTNKRMATVVEALFRDPSQAMSGCEVVLTTKEQTSGNEEDMMLDVFIGSDEGPARHPVRAAFLRSLEDKNLLKRQDWKGLASLRVVQDDLHTLPATYLGDITDNEDSNTVLVSFFEHKLQDESLEHSELPSRILEDYPCQQAFAQAIVKIISESTTAGELDNVAKLCNLLSSNSALRDMILLYICPTQLLQPLAALLDDENLLQNGEEASIIGSILLFAQVVVKQVLCANHSLEDLLPASFFRSFIRSSSSIRPQARLTAGEQSIVASWIAALFGSDGISDELIKSSSPQVMLQITPTLFYQSITACSSDIIDLDTLRGGLTYFLQDLLSYTLPSAIDWLLGDLSRLQQDKPIDGEEESKRRQDKAISIRLDILSMLLLSESCPDVVKNITARKTTEVLKNCEGADAKLIHAMEAYLQRERSARTHLWIRIGQASMPSCVVDSLLGLDVSAGAITRKRGSKAVLQILIDNLHLHHRSNELPRAIAMSLCLEALLRKPGGDLSNDLLLSFTHLVLMPKNSIRSAIHTLDLALQMLSCSSVLKSRTSLRSIEAAIALRVKRLLGKVRSATDVNRVARLYGVLFLHPSSRQTLASCFERKSTV